MRQPVPNAECGCVVEVCGFSLEERRVMLPRLYKVFAASGCWTVSYRRSGRRTMEYSFEVKLSAMVELYCGLVQAGLEMTEVSHRALTELCVLRTHERMLRRTRCITARMVSVRLRMNFVDPQEEIAVPGVVAALA